MRVYHIDPHINTPYCYPTVIPTLNFRVCFPHLKYWYTARAAAMLTPFTAASSSKLAFLMCSMSPKASISARRRFSPIPLMRSSSEETVPMLSQHPVVSDGEAVRLVADRGEKADLGRVLF